MHILQMGGKQVKMQKRSAGKLWAELYNAFDKHAQLLDRWRENEDGWFEIDSRQPDGQPRITIKLGVDDDGKNIRAIYSNGYEYTWREDAKRALHFVEWSAMKWEPTVRVK